MDENKVGDVFIKKAKLTRKVNDAKCIKGKRASFFF